jgi:hypothetical protein
VIEAAYSERVGGDVGETTSASVTIGKIFASVVRVTRLQVLLRGRIASLYPVNSGGSFTGNSGAFAEYRVSARKIPRRISPTDDRTPSNSRR